MSQKKEETASMSRSIAREKMVMSEPPDASVSRTAGQD